MGRSAARPAMHGWPQPGVVDTCWMAWYPRESMHGFAARQGRMRCNAKRRLCRWRHSEPGLLAAPRAQVLPGPQPNKPMRIMTGAHSGLLCTALEALPKPEGRPGAGVGEGEGGTGRVG